ATRPRWRGWSCSLDRKPITPAAIISGDSQPRLKERTWDVRVVPTLAPSMTASAIDSGINPRPANEASSNAVAVLDCSSPVRPRPPAKAVKRFLEQAPMTRRSDAPNARVSPVRTMRTPHSSRATLPRTFRTVSTPCMIFANYASSTGDESFLTNLLRREPRRLVHEGADQYHSPSLLQAHRVFRDAEIG